tara:strand:+ start:3809 stop:4429 length:621 start_codon:yes stop_codon:yes gene_type:complete
METSKDWRNKKRSELLALRKTITNNDRMQWSKKITNLLENSFPTLYSSSIGFYWPCHGEYDPYTAMISLQRHGATIALPEVEGRKKPLCFRRWWDGVPMKIGAYNIPVPDNTELVILNAMIVPMLGFDQKGYRLGYGGGYYDRTIFSINPRPLVIGVAFEISRLDNIYPNSQDVAMDFIVTELGVYQVSKKGISLISINKCAIESL